MTELEGIVKRSQIYSNNVTVINLELGQVPKPVEFHLIIGASVPITIGQYITGIVEEGEPGIGIANEIKVFDSKGGNYSF